MRRLSGLDSMFLSLESDTNLFHVGAVAVLDPSTAPEGAPPPHEAFVRVVESRLDQLPQFRRRLVGVPTGLDHPRWLEDTKVDLAHHIKRGALPSPGGERELTAYIADFLSRPLDRSRPLWEIHVVEGLEGGLVAGVAKIHHSLVDGIAGAEVTAHLMDLEPLLPGAQAGAGTRDGEAPRASTEGETEGEGDGDPSGRSLAWEVGKSTVERTFLALRLLGKLTMTSIRIRSRNRERDTIAPPSPFRGPHTALTTKVGNRRAVGMARVELDDVQRVRTATGATVNDVIMMLTGSAIREYLEERDELPEASLVGFMPISVRPDENGGRDPGDHTNRLSGTLVSLATDVADPVVRLMTVSESARSAKAQDRLVGPDFFSEMAELSVPALLSPAARFARASGFVTRWPPFSVVVSSFPGAPVALYCGGAEMVAYHPFGPVVDGAALNVTAMSYKDHIAFGLQTSPNAVRDVDALSQNIPDAMRELTKAVAACHSKSQSRRKVV